MVVSVLTVYAREVGALGDVRAMLTVLPTGRDADASPKLVRGYEVGTQHASERPG